MSAAARGPGDRGTPPAQRLALVVAVLLFPCLPAPLSAQQAARPGRSCQVHVDSALGGTRILTMADGTQNVFSGGGVWARCLNQPTTISSDSLAYTQATGVLQFIRDVHFRDSTAVLDADRVTYWLRQERLFAEGNVYTRNLETGSELRGPSLDYYRAVPPIRDTLQIYATGRPLIHLREAADTSGDQTVEPFVVRADRAWMRGRRAMWGSGRVTIDRSDLAARADSAFIDLADSTGLLVGSPVVTARDTTRRADSVSYRLTGQRIRFTMAAGRQIRRVVSMGDADATGPGWHLVSDTLDLALDSARIQRAQAWGTEVRPRAAADQSTITADSLDIRMPGQVMDQVLAYGAARATSRPDTTRPEEDWLAGDSLHAHFARTDSGGAARSEIRRVVAFGSTAAPARSYYHVDNERDRSGPRGISYSRGQRIRIAMHERKVRTVDIVGQVDGVYLEPLPPGADSAAADTVPADTTVVRRATPRPSP